MVVRIDLCLASRQLIDAAEERRPRSFYERTRLFLNHMQISHAKNPHHARVTAPKTRSIE
jgi:hypothetical protein